MVVIQKILMAYVYNMILLTHVDVKQCSAFHK